MSRVIVIGGGVGGLSAAALLSWSGHRVTLLEAGRSLGGKSQRIELEGQLLDTGPSLFTFPSVWEELLARLARMSGVNHSAIREFAGLKLDRLPNVGQYYYRDDSCSLPVPPGHAWHSAWERFADMHGPLGAPITRLLTTAPTAPAALPSLARLGKLYGRHLTTRSYLDSLTWLPDGLREIIAIHTLNAGVGPSQTPALYASMPAVMAHDGVWVPRGGVYELIMALKQLAVRGNVDIRTDEEVSELAPGAVTTSKGVYVADVVVSGIDEQKLQTLLGRPAPTTPQNRSCSAIGLYAVLKHPLPGGTAQHSVVLPDDPSSLYASLRGQQEPAQTMAFVNYYPADRHESNTKDTLALLLTSPANGRSYRLDSSFVSRELSRVSNLMGLGAGVEDLIESHHVLDPKYFSVAGSGGGALYGRIRPLWMSGPFHQPRAHSSRHPWLWRVGASVHPGGGLPAVMGGAMMTVDRLNRSLSPT